jgi:POB3-like N-terminal PH domain
MSSSSSTSIWKHVGLRSHSVGTFSCEPERIVWKSALTGDDVDMHRTIPKSQVVGALWTVFGKSGHLRIQTKGSGNLKHELRFDGFPPNDFDALKTVLQANYGIVLKPHTMSSAGAQYGITTIANKNLVYKHCVLDEMNEEGQEFEPRAEDEMLSLDLAEVSQCVLPGNNRNEIELQFPESDTIEAGTDQLGTSFGFSSFRLFSLRLPTRRLGIMWWYRA